MDNKAFVKRIVDSKYNLAVVKECVREGFDIDTPVNSGSEERLSHLVFSPVTFLTYDDLYGDHLKALDKYLLENSNVNQPNKLGQSCVHYACKYGISEAVGYYSFIFDDKIFAALRARGADFNLEDSFGRTPVEVLVESYVERRLSLPYKKLIELSKKGVDLTAKNSSGRSAMDIIKTFDPRDISEEEIEQWENANEYYYANCDYNDWRDYEYPMEKKQDTFERDYQELLSVVN